MSTNNAALVITATMTNAEFRLMSSFMADVMQSGGITKTADTGQIDLTTANFPGSNDTYAGYEIRAFTDALQATAPVYLKIEYGRGPGANCFAVRLTWGSGSDGSGTITGTFSGGTATQHRLAEGTSTFTNSFVSAGTCRFAVVFQTTTLNSILVFERTINASKVYTSDGIMILPYKTGQTTGSRLVPRTGTAPTAEVTSSGGSCLPPQSQTSGLRPDSNKAVYPYYFFGTGQVYPCTNLVGCFTADYTADNTYTVNVLGADQTMVRLRLDAGGSAYMQRGGSLPTPANFTGMMRYE